MLFLMNKVNFSASDNRAGLKHTSVDMSITQLSSLKEKPHLGQTHPNRDEQDPHPFTLGDDCSSDLISSLFQVEDLNTVQKSLREGWKCPSGDREGVRC